MDLHRSQPYCAHVSGDARINGHLIRRATVADLPGLVELGRKFHEASGYADIAEFDALSFATTLQNAPDAVFLVVEKAGHLVGMAGALVYPFYFNLKHRTAQEVFWWVNPEHRGIGSQLFDALVAEVKAMGAQSLSMIALENATWVGGFYEKRGFRPSERSFIKGI
jgi:ribosomal protein S18 acetylase RimI-like enzyme